MGSESWRSVAVEVAALCQAQASDVQATRQSVTRARSAERRQDEAAIRQGFAHRFLLAMAETCTVRRVAAIEAVRREQKAAVEMKRQKADAETPSALARALTPLQQRQRNERRSLMAKRRLERLAARPPAGVWRTGRRRSRDP